MCFLLVLIFNLLKLEANMKKHQINARLFLLLSLSFLLSCNKNGELSNQAGQNSQLALNNKSMMIKSSVKDSATVFASGFSYPRGLKFGPDGYLYVALAGSGGTDSTTCTQVIPPVGPYRGGLTSSIIKISPSGVVSTVVDKLPSSKNGEGAVLGVADVAFVGNKLYALLNAGCSHGNANVPTSVIKINRDSNTFKVVADISTYFHNNPVFAPEMDDFEPDGTPYSLLFTGGDFYAVEPNHGELLKITLWGTVKRVLDFSAHYGHIVPTAMTHHNGEFYVGNLRTFPLVADSSNIYKVTKNGNVSIYASSFTGVLGVAFDKKNRLYVLETSAGGGPIPMTGRVVRINNNNSREVIVDKLLFPTAMIFGPDGALYISNAGYGPPTGQILKVVIKDNAMNKENAWERRDDERRGNDDN
jgi:hypothetical protein